MSMPGPIDMEQGPVKRRRSARSKFIARLFAVGIVSGLIGGGVAIVQQVEAEAASQVSVNRFIRANGGIPPCKWEDGSGQPGVCYWDASERGNKKGRDFVAVPVKAGHDKRIVFLTK